MNQNNRKVGREYEELAARYLTDKGYDILEMNYRTGRDSEIDIISKDRDTVVFVEVKYRSNASSGHPFESVDYKKQRKICAAAKRYIYNNRLSEYGAYRFDVIGILNDKIEHIENAFEYVGR